MCRFFVRPFVISSEELLFLHVLSGITCTHHLLLTFLPPRQVLNAIEPLLQATDQSTSSIINPYSGPVRSSHSPAI